MNNLLCPVCGRSSDHQIEGKCRDCFKKTVTIAHIDKVVHAVICPMCRALKRGAQWDELDMDIEDMIKDVIKKELVIHPDAADIGISIEVSGSNPSIYQGDIHITADIGGIKLQSTLHTEVRISRETCDVCSKMAGGYYEAVVQIRAEGRFPGGNEQEKVLELVGEVLDRQRTRGDRLAFISKVEKLREGTDVYIGSNSTAKLICRTASERFGCRYSGSPSLAGKKDGRDIYRITYSLRLPRFVPGDIIRIGNKAALVMRSGKRISGLYLGPGLEFSDNTDRFKDAVKIGDIKDSVSAVLLCVEHDTVQIMHPETYRPVTINRPAYRIQTSGDEVKIVIFGDEIFILPPECEDI